MTVYFQPAIPRAMLIELTATESKAGFDQFISVLWPSDG